MIFDTDVLIWALRGDRDASETIAAEPSRKISLVSHLELLQNVRDKVELASLRRFLVAFVTLPLSEEIGYRARIFMEEHALSISLGFADALIAATAIEAQSRLCTANLKHFRAIKGLELKAYRR